MKKIILITLIGFIFYNCDTSASDESYHRINCKAYQYKLVNGNELKQDGRMIILGSNFDWEYYRGNTNMNGLGRFICSAKFMNEPINSPIGDDILIYDIVGDELRDTTLNYDNISYPYYFKVEWIKSLNPEGFLDNKYCVLSTSKTMKVDTCIFKLETGPCEGKVTHIDSVKVDMNIGELIE